MGIGRELETRVVLVFVIGIVVFVFSILRIFGWRGGERYDKGGLSQYSLPDLVVTWIFHQS